MLAKRVTSEIYLLVNLFKEMPLRTLHTLRLPVVCFLDFSFEAIIYIFCRRFTKLSPDTSSFG